MKVATYYRVSTADQNVNLQRNAIATLCARHSDWRVTEYVDTGVSGTKDSRPELNKLMADCRRGKIDRVIVWRFDRFARSVSHLLRALEEFRALNVDFVSVTESIDFHADGQDGIHRTRRCRRARTLYHRRTRSCGTTGC